MVSFILSFQKRYSYPPHMGLVEGHLNMPLVHWLPKNRIRKAYILLLMLVGFRADLPSAKGKGILKKADVYYRTINEETFYRHWRVVQRSFERHGFNLEFISVRNPRLCGIPGWAVFMRSAILRWIINWLLLSFVGVALVTTKTTE